METEYMLNVIHDGTDMTVSLGEDIKAIKCTHSEGRVIFNLLQALQGRAATTDDAVAAAVNSLVDAVAKDTPFPSTSDLLYAVMKHQGCTRREMRDEANEFLLYLATM